MELIQIFVELENPDILCFTEHFLKQDEICILNLESFNLASSFCRKTYKNGGTCIYVKDYIEYEELDLKQFCLEKHCEMSGIKIRSKPELLIFVMYRNPPGDLKQFFINLDLVLNKFFTNQRHIVVVGDFNIDCNIRESFKTKELVCAMSMYGLKQKVFTFTRVMNESKTIIDNIFTNINHDNTKTEVLVSDLSDHYAQSLTCALRNIKPS